MPVENEPLVCLHLNYTCWHMILQKGILKHVSVYAAFILSMNMTEEENYEILRSYLFESMNQESRQSRMPNFN